MAKQLKDILKAAHDTIKGVRASTTTAGSIGKDPGVDYDPKAGDEREFVAKHSMQRWDDPHGNPNPSNATKYVLDKASENRHGNTEKEAEKAYFRPVKEAKGMKCEGCGSMYEGKTCGCGAKPVKKLEEVLTKKTSAGEVISDFQKSKDKKFAGKSKEERKRMALGAYYSMHPEKSKKANEEVEQIDELSPATLSSYKSKAAGSERALTDKSSSLSVPAKDRNVAAVKANQRRQGMQLATKKLSEEVDIAEDLAVPLLQSHDDSGYSMTKAELKALANKAMHLVATMPDNMHVEPWCQAKIAQAKSMISDVHDYMLYSDKDKEEDEQTDTPMTFPNMSVDVNTGQNV